MPKSPLIRQEKKKKIALKTPLESQKHTEELKSIQEKEEEKIKNTNESALLNNF